MAEDMGIRFLDGSLREYLGRAASDAPVPGGGSVAALAGALSASMAAMAARFTQGRKKYAEVAGEIDAMVEAFDMARVRMSKAVERDAEAFAAFGAAYALPKDSPESLAAREAAIQAALRGAAATPMELLRILAETTPSYARLASIGNPNLVSDTGVAAYMSAAAAAAAELNVRVNAKLISDAEAGRRMMDEARGLRELVEGASREAVSAVEARIK